MTTPVSLSSSPFAVGSKVTDPRFFVGRQVQVDLILRKMMGDQPTSVNVVGARRIGKSSLLHHIYQTYEDKAARFNRQATAYVVVELSLQQANCRDQAAFYRAAAQAFLSLPKVQRNSQLVGPLQGVMDAAGFATAIRSWQSVGVLPVVCLDNFEELLAQPGRPNPNFDDGFYDNLRSLMDDRALMMVLASRSTVEYYSRRQRLTSDFFNLFTTCELGELTESEARDLIRLPKQGDPALSERRQELALDWAGSHPCLLAIAGDVLFEAKTDDRDDRWARRAYDRRRQGIERRLQGWKLVVHLIQRLGALGQDIGDTIDDWGNFAKGMMILVLIGLLSLGAASSAEIKTWIKNMVNETVDSAE